MSTAELVTTEVIQEREVMGRGRVDAASGVIRGVKILGQISRNGREYPPATLRAGAALYEGAKVNVNHPKGSANASRDYQDRLGTLRSVRVENGGLYADLHYNPKHPVAGQLAWDAEHAPENVGMSHNVEAKTSKKNGRVVVESIVKVQSVDLVADPATTNSLFESAEQAEAVANMPNGVHGKSSLNLGNYTAEYTLVEALTGKSNPERLAAFVEQITGRRPRTKTSDSDDRRRSFVNALRS